MKFEAISLHEKRTDTIFLCFDVLQKRDTRRVPKTGMSHFRNTMLVFLFNLNMIAMNIAVFFLFSCPLLANMAPWKTTRQYWSEEGMAKGIRSL